MAKKKTSLLDRIGLLLSISVVLVVSFFMCTPVRAVVLVMAGRGIGCPLNKAVKTESMSDEHDTIMKRISSSIRNVREDASAGLHLLDSSKGQYWLPKSETNLLAALLAEQEEKIYGSGAMGVRPGDIVLDCGAHVGAFTRAALDSGAKLVVAIEPAPTTLECLRRNLAAEVASGRVIIVPEGVWDKEGKLPFHIDPLNSAGNSLLSEKVKGGTTIEVPLTTIDNLVARLKLERVDFVKMDIEGAEPNALRGAAGTLAKYRPRMAICTYHTPTDPANVLALARELQPNYRTECGKCQDMGFRITPQTVLFY